MRAIDYATGRPTYAALKAAGAVAVCRYLSWLPNGKCLSRSEADGLRANGIDVVSNWEYYGDWTHDYSGGFGNGVVHAVEAQKQHLACGGPPGRPIYFSTDFSPTAGQLPIVADYYRGVASVIGLARTGAYGGLPTIKYLFDHGVITWGWQTYAWSGSPPVWDGRAQLRQVQNGVTIGGVDCDLDDTMVSDFGQWGVSNVEQTDIVRKFDPKGRKVEIGWVLGDVSELRDTIVTPPPGETRTRLDLVVDAAIATRKIAQNVIDLKAYVNDLQAEIETLRAEIVTPIVTTEQLTEAILAAIRSMAPPAV